MIAALAPFGSNAATLIWRVALGVITVGFTAALILMGVSLIRRPVNN